MKTNWILNTDGSIYHLGLTKEQLATTIITVGDPERVPSVSRFFDHVEFKSSRREFVCHTGRIGNKRISILSTGIGTDNIDIVINECDALFNIDFKTGATLSNTTQLDFIRIGTSGAIQQDIPVDSFLISEFAIGTDSLMNFYSHLFEEKSKDLTKEFHLNNIPILNAYYSECNKELLDIFSNETFLKGVTLTAPGFYAPQGRTTRVNSSIEHLLQKYSQININSIGRITNIEMETAGIYGLSTALGHRAISLNAILANRITGEFSKEPEKSINHLIETCISNIIT